MADPDARRRAEEALRRVLANAAAIVRLSWSDGATPSDRANLERIKSAAADIAQDHKILRALLAAGPEAKAPGHDRIAELESLLRECNAVCLCGCPDSEHESYGEDGESCGDEEHECIRVPSAVLAYVQDLRQNWADLGEDYEGLRARINPPHPSWDTSCARCGRDLTVSSATCGECCAETPAAGVVEVTPAPPSPAGDAVREAAERLRASLVAVPSWEALLPKNCGACEGESDCAGEHEPCGCHETLAVIEASLALLAALRATASPAPGSEEVREAEAVLAEAREALDEIRRRSTDKLAGGIAASFLGAHPRAALRGVQKGEVG